MTNSEFIFMPQNRKIEDLLHVCQDLLSNLPESKKLELETVLRPFEVFGTSVLWSSADVPVDRGLTNCEKEEAVLQFLENYEVPGNDYELLDQYASEVLSNRTAHIKVLFDTAYFGGDYFDTPGDVLIPLSVIESFRDQDPERGDGVDLAFSNMTKQDPLHIIKYDRLSIFNKFGEPLLTTK
jgi:hypothetical protein